MSRCSTGSRPTRSRRGTRTSLWLSSEGAENALKPLLEEAVPLRENLLSDAEALARRGLLDAETVAEIRAGQGHIDTANDLVRALGAVQRELVGDRRQDGGDRGGGEPRRGDRAAAPRRPRREGARQGPGPTEAADKRARAFSLLVHAYDQTRRAVAYLRWNEGDADAIAPSAVQGPRRSRGVVRAIPAAAPEDAATAGADGAGIARGAIARLRRMARRPPLVLNGTTAHAVAGPCAERHGTGPAAVRLRRRQDCCAGAPPARRARPTKGPPAGPTWRACPTHGRRISRRCSTTARYSRDE